jgi:DNA-binding LytR/AlgR family response regulator
MTKIKCLLVDDEPLAQELLKNHISKIDRLEVIATCSTAMKAFEIISTQKVDLLFLDIKMPSMTGLQLLKTLRHPPKTIFTTAYREYAFESYELEAVDYLLKPITFERFVKAVDRFIRKEATVLPSATTVAEKEYILLKSGTKFHKILLDHIVYVESLKDYVKVYLEDGKKVLSKYKIGSLEAELPATTFLRVHRSYLINTQKITAFTLHDIEVGAVEIPIGASYKERAMAFLDRLK